METRLKFLDDAPEVLGSGGETLKLGSHFRYLRSLFLQQGDWNIPKKKDPLPSTCSHCLMEFRGTPYTVTVKASSKPSRNVMKILEKKARLEKLTEAQSLLLTHHEATRGKKLILRCGLCQKETETVLRKLKEDPKTKPINMKCGTKDTNKLNKLPQSKVSSSVPPPKLTARAPPHGKKKKKDQFAGLKRTAVMSQKVKKKM